MKTQAFIDTDVVLDFLIDREPFSTQAALIFALGEAKKTRNIVSPLTFSNCYYILRKLASHDKVVDKLKQFASIVEICRVNKQTIQLALNSGFKDFEDAIQNFSAIQIGQVDVLITRNTKDYKTSKLSVMEPETFLKTLTED